MLSKKAINKDKTIARHIGTFYLKKHDMDYGRANTELQTLGVTGIHINGNTVTVTLRRPGLFIGAMGKNLGMLQKYLSDKLENTTALRVVEDTIIDCMFV